MAPFTIKSSRLIAITTLTICLASLCQGILIPAPMLRQLCAKLADAEEAAGVKALAAGKFAAEVALKPIAVIGGLHAAAVGTGMKATGAGVKIVGLHMAKDGAKLELAGSGVKGAGLGVAALALRPVAEKVVTAGNVANKSLTAASAAASSLAKSVGDTSVSLEGSIDSPLIGHHHKEVNVTSGLGEILGAPADSKLRVKRASHVDPEVLKSAFNLVKEAKFEDCVARAVCDLNCNPQGFGADGKQVFMNMVRLQGSNVLNKTETQYYQEAANKGRQSSGKCDQCSSVYESCASNSTNLIKLASHIRMD